MVSQPTSVADLQAQVARFLPDLVWDYADKDPLALTQLTQRIDATIRSKTTITYTDLVAGIAFTLPTIENGTPFQIEQWNARMGGIVGEFLQYIALHSFAGRGTLDSAVVVKNQTLKPQGKGGPRLSSGFFELAEVLGLLVTGTPKHNRDFWKQELDFLYGSSSASMRVVPF